MMDRPPIRKDALMDLTWSLEEEAFRAEAREWLERNVPKERPDLEGDEETDDQRVFEFRRNWQQKLGEAGYLAMHWPSEYGGRGATLVEQVIWNEEYARARAPQVLNSLGLSLVGPTLMQHGSEEQRQRFLRKILTAEEIWCQGYSEPNAGSDLAGIQTRAEIVDDEFVINGQKTWTTLARWGDWIFALCRTDPEAPKHQGISYILVPMDQSGVEVRPMKQITGTSGFGEVFFTNARTSTQMLVGGLNDGWRVAMTTLMYERGSNLLSYYVTMKRLMSELLETAGKLRRNGGTALDDPSVRQQLGKALVEVEILKSNGLRSISPRLGGDPPGPESSIGKLLWSEWYKRTMEIAMDVLGPYARIAEGAPDELRTRHWLNQYLTSRAPTIYAGTSEIQRNIVAERVLGLPRGGRK
jgi:alkylation response protein AidB-like acyl-CoA dehydrogenase